MTLSTLTNMSRPLSAIVAVTLAGCSTLTLTDSKAPEGVYQVLSGVDYSETVNVARRPDCFRETGEPAAVVIGAHPSVRGVEAYWAAQALAHWAVSAWLDRRVDDTDSRAWRVTRWIWHAASIEEAGRAVINNTRMGLRPFGAGCSR